MKWRDGEEEKKVKGLCEHEEGAQRLAAQRLHFLHPGALKETRQTQEDSTYE